MSGIDVNGHSLAKVDRLQSAFGRLPWEKDWIAAGAVVRTAAYNDSNCGKADL
jgi:hypothetical protein